MRTIQTRHFGPLDVADDSILTLPEGLLGFPHLREAILLPVTAEGPLFWLQSVTDPMFSILLINPEAWAPEMGRWIQAERPDFRPAVDAVLNIVIITNAERQEARISFTGPILIDGTTRQLRQITLPVPGPHHVAITLHEALAAA